jgi:hypothetical protein
LSLSHPRKVAGEVEGLYHYAHQWRVKGTKVQTEGQERELGPLASTRAAEYLVDIMSTERITQVRTLSCTSQFLK